MHSAASLAARDGAFEILITTPRTQVATMILHDGQESGPFGTDHPQADQTLFVLDGHCQVQIEEIREELGPGDMILIPAGASHQVTGLGMPPCRTLNVYGPAAYVSE